jgi:hypothetical protein
MFSKGRAILACQELFMKRGNIWINRAVSNEDLEILLSIQAKRE